jgi:hypothetical protein
MKICPVGVELFHADGRQSVTMMVITAFRNFATAPKNAFLMCQRLQLFGDGIDHRVGVKDFSHFQRVKNASGTPAEVKNSWIYTSTSHTFS